MYSRQLLYKGLMITSYTKTALTQTFDDTFPEIIKDYNKYKGFIEYPTILKGKIQRRYQFMFKNAKLLALGLTFVKG